MLQCLHLSLPFHAGQGVDARWALERIERALRASIVRIQSLSLPPLPPDTEFQVTVPLPWVI